MAGFGQKRRDHEPTPDDQIEEFFDDAQAVAMYRWRVEQLERAGFKHLHVVALATADDREAWRTAVELVEDGCDHDLAVRIAL